MASFACELEFYVFQLCCRDASFLPGGDVFLRIRLLETSRDTSCMPAELPLVLRQRLWFNQVFANVKEPKLVSGLLEDEPVRIELVQVYQKKLGGRLLAHWEGCLRDVLTANTTGLDISSSGLCFCQVVLKKTSHMPGDCVLLYNVNMTLKNRADGSAVDKQVYQRTVPSPYRVSRTDGPVAGHPTYYEPPLNLFEGPSEPRVVVIPERSASPGAHPPLSSPIQTHGLPSIISQSVQTPGLHDSVSEAVQTHGQPSSISQPVQTHGLSSTSASITTITGASSNPVDRHHSLEYCPRRSQPPAPADISLSPLGPHRTLLGAALPRTSTGLSMATSSRSNQTSLCESSTNCRRKGRNVMERHTNERMIGRQETIGNPSSGAPTNPVVQFLENARRRTSSPPPPSRHPDVERSPLRKTHHSVSDHGVGREPRVYRRLLPSESEQALNGRSRPRRSVTFDVSPPRRKSNPDLPGASTNKRPPTVDESLQHPGGSMTSNPVHVTSNPSLPFSQSSPVHVLSSSDDSDITPGPAQSSSGGIHVHVDMSGSSSSCAGSDASDTHSLSCESLDGGRDAPVTLDTFQQPPSHNPHLTPSHGVYTPSTASQPTASAQLGSSSRYHSSASSSRYQAQRSDRVLSADSQRMLDKMKRQSSDLERMTQDLQQRVTHLLETCCGSPNSTHQAQDRHSPLPTQSDTDRQQLEELRSTLHSAREDRLRRSTQHTHQGEVELGGSNYWSARMAEYTGRSHRAMFDETLERVYAGLYDRAQRIS